jgi:glycosyltransferase involved in cell wall biosynthesis
VPAGHHDPSRPSARPDISVIMPVKDTAPDLIDDAVASAIGQDHAGHVELVVWDDGSRDPATVAALEQLGRRRVPHGRSIRTGRSSENRGISDARNQACLLARGRWLIWLDSDDTLPPSAVRTLLGAADAGKHLVVGQCMVTYADGRTATHRNDVYVRSWFDYGGTRHDPLLSTVFAVHGAIVRHNLFWRLTGFDTRLSHGELTDWFLRVLASLRPDQVSVVSDVTYRYNKRDATHSADRDALERHRLEALQRYAEALDRTVPLRLVLADRCPHTGARGYERFDEHGQPMTLPITIVLPPATSVSAPAGLPPNR